MTGIVIGALQDKAVDALGNTFGMDDKGEDVAKGKDVKGRSYTHWSQGFTQGAAVIGLIISVAGYILRKGPITMLGALMFASNGIANHYLKQFIPLGALKEYVDLLTGKINKMGEHIMNVREGNKELKALSVEYKEFKKSAEVEAKEYRKELEEKKEAFNKVFKKLKHLEDQLAAWQELQEKVKGVSASMAEEISRLNEENIKLYGNIGALEKDVKGFQELQSQLDKDVNLYKHENALFAKENDEMQKLTGGLKGEIVSLKAIHNELAKERAFLEEKVGKLEKVVEDLRKELKEVQEVKNDVNKTVTQIEDSVDQVTENLDRLGHLNALAKYLERKKQEESEK